MGIGTRVVYNEVKLQANHVLSNEPGYYEDGKFGIRIENLVVVQPAKTAYQFGGVKYLRFETLTMVRSRFSFSPLSRFSPFALYPARPVTRRIWLTRSTSSSVPDFDNLARAVADVAL